MGTAAALPAMATDVQAPSHMSLKSRVLSTCGIWALLALPAVGQLTRGYISGTVQDGTGAVVPNAKVKIRNVATGLETDSRTNDIGFYRFAAVESGAYSVEFAAEGFQTRRVDGLRVLANGETTLN